MPKVRLSVLDPGGTDAMNRAEDEWPPARAEHRKLFLDAVTGSLSPAPVTNESLLRYKTDEMGQAVFTMTLTRDVELIGYAKEHLWVEAEGSEDMDLFVNVSKIDSEGNPLPARVFGVADPGAGNASSLALGAGRGAFDTVRALPHPSRGTTSQAGRDRGSGHRHMAYGHALARRTEALYHREGNSHLMG